MQRHDKDSHDLASTIAQYMQKHGLQATAGVESARPADVAHVVTYVDKWMWDMRMYGESMQSSLKAMGQTHEDIVNNALDKMFPW